MHRKIFLLLTLLTLCFQSIKAESYAKHLKGLITRMEERSDIDPDSFAIDIKLLETELQDIDKKTEKQMPSEKKVTYKAIIRGVMATAYRNMLRSSISAFDSETQEKYTARSKELFGRVLEDMLTLSKENSKDYEPIVKIESGGKYYGHNMLAVMLDFVSSNNRSMNAAERDSLHRAARRIYQMNGDWNSDTMLRLKELQYPAWGTDEEKQQYCRQLEALRGSTRDIDAGQLVSNQLDIAVNNVMAKEIDIRVEKNILAGRDFKLEIKSRNATTAKLQVFQFNGKDTYNIKKADIGKELLQRNYILSDENRIKEGRSRYVTVKDSTFDSMQLPAGRYLFVATTEGDTARNVVKITTLHHLIFHTPDGKTHIKVVDRISGMPQEGVAVLLYPDRNKEDHDTFTTDRKGEVVVASDKYRRMLATRTPDRLNTCEEDATGFMIIDFYDYRHAEGEKVEGSIFTDRGIYRPGQTVHASAMIYTMIGDDTKVRTQGKYILELTNPDGEAVESVTLSPDNMGTMSHDFTLPKGKLGSWHLFLKSENSRQWEHISSNSINVEEYKRPTYLPEFRKDTTVYSPDDNIEVVLDVRTLSGLPVQNANVSITIEAYRQALWFYNMSEPKYVNIETVTNDEGKALFDFCPSRYEEIKELIDEAKANEKLRVRITAFVTDQAGESHYAKTSYLIPLKPVKKDEESKKPEPLQVSKKEIKVGESVDITFNPEHKDAYVFYYVVANDRIIDSSEKVVNAAMRRTLRCTKDWGDGANIYIMYVKDGEILRYNKTVKVPKPDKELKLQWHTMRDHLTPGQEEQWVLSVKDKNGKAVAGANLLAAMYDAALDEFNTFDWSFQIPFVTNITSLNYRHTQPTRSFNLALRYIRDIKDIMPGSFDYLEHFLHECGNLGRGMIRLRGMRPVLKEVMVSAKPMESYEALDMAPMAANGKIAGLSPEMLEEFKGGKADEPGDVKPNIRENFNETAFFYPNLQTDTEGNAQIRFTLPESLTEWKFLGFAHTDDVRYGLIQSTAVAQKDFMVQPQLPRFIRTNDDATIQARIQNQSSRLISGTATMRLISAKDESTIIKTQNLPFSVEAGKSSTVTFNIPSGSLNEDVVCEIFATAEGCSDGERNLLPVLQTRETITENIPFYIEGATTKDIDISSLYNNDSPTATDRTLEIGYTDNPALDVFRALRAVQMPQHDNAPCYAAALYSNIVMISIYDQLSETSNDTLLHNFDRERAQALADEAASKLESLQLENGSWSWFKGMEGSPYITLAVAEHLHRLKKYQLSIINYQLSMVNEMLSKAMSYLDKYMQEDYEKRKVHKWSLTPNEFDLRYMAICEVTENEMLKTYVSQLAKQQKNMTIFGKAKGALILQRFGKTKDARNFTESVKHYLVFKPGFGRYFATDIAYYSWQDYRLPTHLAAMRCLTNVDKEKNAKLLPDMQMWLLRQKQTQLWRNPLNAIDAADYLLTYSKEESLRQADTLQVRLGGETYKVSSTPINPIAPISPSSPFKIEKHSPGISWGYVRGTFTEEAERLNSYTTGELSIEQKMYVKQRDEWVEMTEDTPLITGMIVRIRNIIHADRDMDFVSVTTKHPACLEPVKTLSGYTWFGRRGGYLELHDTETAVFFDWFTRGTTTLDLEYYVTRTGTYHSGISTATCEYAPEFSSYVHTFNLKIK